MIFTRLLTFLFMLLSNPPLQAGPLQDGVQAFEAGNYTLALELWTPLAKQGDADAQYNLGLLHANGWGVPKNPREAMRWYTLAARQGVADAQFNLGLFYAEGLGTFRSDRDAVEWWELAAKRDHAEARFNLGLMYAYGRGCDQETSAAIREWEAAAARGHPGAAATLKRVYTEGLFGVTPDPERAARWNGLTGAAPQRSAE